MNLLMLTKFYPFGTGEAFIENEIKVLSEYYEEIVIIACETPVNVESVRNLPPNVKAYKILESSKKKDLLNGIVKFNKRDKQVREEKKECDNILQKLFLAYFEEKCQRIYKTIISQEYLNEITKKSYVIYSYWFFMTARVGILISDKFKPYKMFTRAHRYDLYEEKNKLGYLPYRKMFLKEYDNVFPCSDNGTEHLRKLYPELVSNVRTAFLGTIDHGIGQASSDDVFRIVSCSRVEPVKRVEKIAEALSKLENKNIKIEWTHIGDGSEFEKLKKIAEATLHNIKTIFYGNMKNQEIMNLYASHPYDL